MKLTGIFLTLSISALVTGCSNLDGSALQAGMTGLKAATLSDAEVIAMSNDACQEMDARAEIAPSNSDFHAPTKLDLKTHRLREYGEHTIP